MRYDVLILGAGPAGLTASYHAAATGKRVLTLDKASRPGTKLLLSGGGKGNVTNRHVESTDYVGEYPSFAKYALERVTPDVVCQELKEARISLEEREYGRIFCTVSTHRLLDLLLTRLPRDRCTVRTGSQVKAIHHTDGVFHIDCGTETWSAPQLIMSTGSPAWPQSGADDSGLRLVSAFGHRVMPPRPVLVPLIMPPDWQLAGLSGISIPVRIACTVPGSPQFKDSLLFTHKGISGPAVLQISCWWRKNAALTIDFLPDENAETVLDNAIGKATPLSIFSRRLPERLCLALLDPALADRRAAELSRRQRAAIADALHRHTVTPSRSEGLGKAEAAAGGVDVAGINPLTMESRRVHGLFFCGEIMDVTGRLGGYNLHWAWASGTVAGEAVAGHGKQ